MDKEFFRLIEEIDDFIPSPQEKLDNETLVCECFCVSALDIRDVCQVAVDLDLLKERFMMGEGCRSCIKNKDSWVNNIF